MKKCQRIMARTVHIQGHSSNQEDHRCDGSRLRRWEEAVSDLVGCFPTHLKNMRIVKMGSSSPIFGVNIKKEKKNIYISKTPPIGLYSPFFVADVSFQCQYYS